MNPSVRTRRHGPFPGAFDATRIAAYAEATGDTTPAVLAGDGVPATLPVLLVFDAAEAARADLPAEIWERIHGGVHGEHDLLLHRPLRPGEFLDTWSEVSAVRTVRSGTQVVVHFDQVDADGQLAAEQWWTMILLGAAGLDDLGSMPADHRFPEPARVDPLPPAVLHVAADTAHRYAELSGDWAAHHFDLDVARAAGFDYVFAHGLCTMAMCTHRVLDAIGVGDPSLVRRVAVRFAAPMPLGADLTTSTYGIDENAFAFEAHCGDAVVVSHGRLELRP